MSNRLHDKVAVITGAASGIGLATAQRFCREGAAVTLVDLQMEPLEQVTAELGKNGGRVLPIAADVAQTDKVCQVVESTVRHFGRVDVLFANAGVPYSGDILSTPDEAWDKVMATNAKGVFICCREVIRQMLAQQPSGGSLILNASISGLAGLPGQACYAPSKGAVVQLTRQLAVEYAARGIRVNCVCPGTIDTPLLRKAMEMSGDPQAFLNMLTVGHPIGRIGNPDEIAAAVAFLASDEASFITGAIVPVDGGYTAK